MFKHYLTTALRYFARNKFTTAINLLCLIIGMLCFAAAYGVVAWFTNADRHYANADRIYFATEQLTLRAAVESGAPAPQTSWVLGKMIRANLPELPAVARLTPAGDAPVSFDDGVPGERQSAFVGTAFADPEFLDIFDLPFVSGDPKAALKSPRSAIVTRAMAQRIFGRTDVIGKALLFRNKERVVITGVVAGFEQPSSFGSGTALIQFEMLVSMDTYEAIVRADNSPTRINEALNTWGANMGTFVYLLLPKDGSMSQAALNLRLEALAKQNAPTDEGTFHVGARPVTELYSTLADAVVGTRRTGISSVAILLMLGGLILLVSCINYANLATAQAATRAREVAMRRVVGAGRSEIARQYLFETALLTTTALVIALAVAIALLSTLSGTQLLSSMLSSPQLWSILVGTAVVVTLLAGVYPTVALSSVRPIQVLRTGGAKGSGPRFVPTLLVGVQFGAASFLLIALLIIQAQNSTLERQRTASLGEPVLAVTNSLREAGVDLQVLRDELARSPYVETVAAADEVPGGLSTGNHRIVSASPEASAGRFYVTTNSIDDNYFKALRINLLAGRAFDLSHRDAWNQNTAQSNDVMNVVVNRALAEQAGWKDPAQAVGQPLYGHAGLGEHELTMRVIGVVETRPLALIGFGTLANLYTLEPERARLPIVRLSRDNTQEGVAALNAVWKKLSPNVPLRRVFVDEVFARTFRILPLISRTFTALVLFALSISVMGLIGMATHVTARRTREIGVRKTLGASVSRILGLLLRDFSKPVVIANLLMWPLAYIVMKAYISLFMVQSALNALPFVLGLAITAAVACASVVVQATKAARMKPATVLRCE